MASAPSACSSTTSVQKSIAASSNCTTSGNRLSTRDNVCSSNTSCFLQKKKPTHPLAASIRPFVVKQENNVRQRVRSAKMIKMRSLQSQLNDANYHLMELAQENRALKTLQKRQDKALKNYEGVNADLPRLIQCHEEENRVLSEKNKVFKKTIRELTEQVKIKDEELISVKDQLRHLMDLAKDKNLEEREKLRQNLEEAKHQNKDYEQQISVLNRKLMLEVKNCKQKLNAEVLKNRRSQQELAAALQKLEISENLKETRLSRRRLDASPSLRKSQTSLTSVNGQEKEKDAEVKLEPIAPLSSTMASNRNSLTSPAEKIKARLSSGRTIKNTEDVVDVLEKLQKEEDLIKKTLRNGIKAPKIMSTKLEALQALKPIHNNHNSEEADSSKISFDESKPSSGNSSNSELDVNFNSRDLKSEVTQHIKQLEDSKAKIEKKQEELQSEEVDHNLQKPEAGEIKLKETDYDLVNEIWSEEFSFRKSQRDRNGNISIKKDPIVALENKQKLLAALKDIDNGKSIEEHADQSFKDQTDTGTRKSRLLKELFG